MRKVWRDAWPNRGQYEKAVKCLGGRQAGGDPHCVTERKAWLGLEVAMLVSSYSQADGERCRGQHPKVKKKLAEGVSYPGEPLVL